MRVIHWKKVPMPMVRQSSFTMVRQHFSSATKAYQNIERKTLAAKCFSTNIDLSTCFNAFFIGIFQIPLEKSANLAKLIRYSKPTFRTDQLCNSFEQFHRLLFFSNIIPLVPSEISEKFKLIKKYFKVIEYNFEGVY